MGLYNLFNRKSGMKKTAVEFLVEQFSKHYAIHQLEDEIEQAKKMEKEQIIEAYNSGQQKEAKQEFWTKGAQYYNETYHSGKGKPDISTTKDK